MPRFLFYFAYTLQSFRMPELIALAEMEGIHLTYDKDRAAALESSDDPTGESLLVVELKSREEAKKLASRAILIKAIYEIIADGESYEALKQNLINLPIQDIVDGTTWKMELECFGRSYTHEVQLEKMHSLKGVPFLEKGKVKMKNPEKRLCIIEDVGILRKSTDNPRRVYFGEIVGEGSRDLIFKYNLKKRPFLGTTSMDPELSLISANMAKAAPSTFMYDPFVGTGSLILACAHFGAHVMGADIDVRTVRNQNPKMRVEANFEHSGLSQYLTGLFLGDNSKRPLRVNPIFDAIVTDPPYGIRAGARKVGRKNKPKWKAVPVGFQQAHFPQCIGYKVSDVMRDLLSLAARTLRVGGRLVYWLPTTSGYKDTDLPLHPCLRVISNCDQKMSTLWSRRLITMEKYKDYTADLDNLDASHYGQLTTTADQLREVVFRLNSTTLSLTANDDAPPLPPGLQEEDDDDDDGDDEDASDEEEEEGDEKTKQSGVTKENQT